MGEFGSDKKRSEFTIEVEQSMERYAKRRRDNLYAIVMPSGSGKTQMCDKYGFVDVDRCSVGSEHEVLNAMRIQCINGKKDWQEHNDYWLPIVTGTLDLLDFTEPVIIMVQSEMLALSIGALPLAGFCCSDDLFSQVYDQKMNKEKNRSGAWLCALNREEFLNHSNIMMKTKRTFNSWDEMESLVLRTMNVNGLSVATPYKYTRAVRNPYYSENCPDWVLTGKGEVNYRQAMSLYDAGDIPKEAMDFFMRRSEIPASFGFGVRMNEWVCLMAMVRFRTCDRKKFNTGSDMADVFPYTYGKMQSRSNITMQRLANGTDVLADEDVLDLVERHVGKPNNFVTGIVCYWEGIGKHLESAPLIKKMLGVSYYYWDDIFKEFHSLVRLSRFFMNTEIGEEERQQLMYIHLYLGKEDEPADWMQEIEDRTCDDPFPDHKSYDCELGTWTRSQYWVDFKKAIAGVYHRMGERGNSDVSSFGDFYERRSAWLTKGSTVQSGLSPELKKYTMGLVDEVGELVGSITGRHNKKSLFEVLDAIPQLDQGFELFNLTKMVTKLDECGHTKRALFPGSFLHYIVFTYVLMAAERQGQVGNVRMNAMPDDDIAYFEMKMERDVPRLLFDWVNYNAFHSLDEMALVIERLGDVVPAGDDYKDFCILIADAMYKMEFLDPDGGMHHFGKGLYSGWRGTTWTNTVLNAVYVWVASLSFERMYGHEPFRMIDGGGDDLDTMLSEHEDGYKMLLVMMKMNMKGKPIKQMIDTKSEFFRNTITIGGVYASANRALAMFINGKWEGSDSVPIEQRIGAILDQVGKMVRRGLDAKFGDTLAVLCLSHWCRIKEGEDWLSLPACVLHGRMEDNGLGIPDRDGNVWMLSDRIPRPKKKREVGDPPDTLASTDYLAVLCRELRQFSVDVINKREIEIKMAKASFDVYDEFDYSEVIKFKAQVIGKQPAAEAKCDKLVYDTFVEYVGIREQDKELGKILRYQELLPYMMVNDKPLSVEKFMDIMGVSLDPDVLLFKGNVYYRRLVAEPLAKLITDFCLEAVAHQGISLRVAEGWFEILCWMCAVNFEFKM
jgi:hypothetical protein